MTDPGDASTVIDREVRPPISGRHARRFVSNTLGTASSRSCATRVSNGGLHAEDRPGRLRQHVWSCDLGVVLEYDPTIPCVPRCAR